MPTSNPNHQQNDDPEGDLSGLDIDDLLDHPYWEPMGDGLDALARAMPETAEKCERTTILTWIYVGNGVLTFLNLSDRITGLSNVTQRKKSARQVLRAMEKLHLIGIVNFPDPDGYDAYEGEDNEGVIGRMSMVSLTWTGMVWLRRAWAARAKIMGASFDPDVHGSFVEEEDDGKGNDPYWVENLTGADPEMAAMAKRAGADQKTGGKRGSPKPITSIFDLGSRRVR